MIHFDAFSHKSLGYQLVKRGISWPAFCFTWVWALTKKLWAYGFTTLAILLIPYLISDNSIEDAILKQLIEFCVPIITIIVFGIQGNSWWRSRLMQSGYELITTIEANNYEDALSRFSQWQKDQQQPGHQIQKIMTNQHSELNHDIYERLQKLGELRDKRILTEDEFELEKRKILNSAAS